MTTIESQDENTAMYDAMEASGNLREGDRDRYEIFRAGWLAGREWARTQIRQAIGIVEGTPDGD